MTVPLRHGLLCLVVAVLFATIARADDQELELEIGDLVASLDADTISERDLAETNLLKLAHLDGVELDKFLELLPKPNDNMPPAVRERLERIRRRLETEKAMAAIKPSNITLEAINWKLSQVLEELEKLSGNKIIDSRKQFNQEVTDPEILLDVVDEPFWSVFDQVLDQSKLGLNNYAGENALAIMDREPGQVDRAGSGAYTGPFRFEVTQATATRSLRNPSIKRLDLDLEIAWEPRLRPIAITQSIEMMEATDDQGKALAPAQPGRVFQIEVQEGSCASTISAPFELPERSVSEITRLRGAIAALVPGKIQEFRFDDLTAGDPITQDVGGVQVSLLRVVKNNDIWEVHMNFQLGEGDQSLESHRGWVYNNPTYIEDKDGKRIDNIGFETIKQNEREVGFAYLFDLPDGPDGLTWVYKSPVGIVQQMFEYEISEIPLP